MLFVAVLVAVVGVVVAAVVGWIPVSGADRPERTHAHVPLDDAAGVDAEAVRDLRFDQVLRGYRPDQVDAALEQLEVALVERDAMIRDLVRERRPAPGDVEPPEPHEAGATGTSDVGAGGGGGATLLRRPGAGS